GASGKKLGSGTTLPLALRRVQLAGGAIRIAEERRLDGSRFVFARMPDAIEIGRAPADDAALDAELARRMLAWAAPATLDEIAWWAGIGKRAARAAVDAIGAKHEIRKPLGEVWSLENEPGAKTSPATPHFLPFRDNYLLFRRSLLPLVDEPGGVEVLSWKNEPIPLAEADSLHQNAIVIGGRLRGVWEFDPEAAEVAWRLFLPATRSEKRDVAEAAESLGRWIRDELGDARFYAFDTAKTRAPRIAFARGERG
ncbi:MAG TPA: crosslink repair DNA glycosylase YcaQ family protein, partial [Thermoanaerobaculia bacterium]|nr:crosslink repair DNA glycosylase YcaQ family protein [Thermoanaerobaculia bacterium]